MARPLDDSPRPRSLVWATDIDVLPADRVVERRETAEGAGHLVVRSPGNPEHWWGNFVIFDAPPGPGDGPRWEAVFAAAFPGAGHRALCWDTIDGDEGAAAEEFVSRGYELMCNRGLIAHPEELVPHPRANREVEIRALDPTPGADAALWGAALEIQLEQNAAEPDPIPDYESFARAHQRDLRELFAAGRGAWYVACDPADGAVVAGCGVVATGPRGRFQAVDTRAGHRRRGICRRLIADAAADASARHGLRDLVIVGDAEYHAVGIYESLGFRVRESTIGIWRRPDADRVASAHVFRRTGAG
jgi:ribosomal protein S18 acetylase RimI-like enzyme